VDQETRAPQFAAEVEVTKATSTGKVVGRFFRDSHGCGRLETGPEGETVVIYIQNVPRSEYYTWTKQSNQWVVGPMKLPKDGWKPMARRENLRGLLKHSQFVEVRRGKPFNLHADAGLTAYLYTNLSGTLTLEIPELNFFPVIKESLDGRREAYANIEIGEQNEDLFAPPPGVTVATTDKLGGIHVQSPGEAAEHMHEVTGGLRR
jgi:hypothetical protein